MKPGRSSTLVSLRTKTPYALVAAEVLIEVRSQLRLELGAGIDLLDPAAQPLQECGDELLLLVARARSISRVAALHPIPGRRSARLDRLVEHAAEGAERDHEADRHGVAEREAQLAEVRTLRSGDAAGVPGADLRERDEVGGVEVELRGVDVDHDRPSAPRARRRRPRPSAVHRARAARHRRGSRRAPRACPIAFSTRASCDSPITTLGMPRLRASSCTCESEEPSPRVRMPATGARSGVVSGSR